MLDFLFDRRQYYNYIVVVLLVLFYVGLLASVLYYYTYNKSIRVRNILFGLAALFVVLSFMATLGAQLLNVLYFFIRLKTSVKHYQKFIRLK